MIAFILNKMQKNYKRWALISGLLSAAALPPLYVLPLLWAGFAAAWFLTSSVKTFKQAAAVGYWFGFGFFAAGLYWIGNAVLVDFRSFGWLFPFVLFGSGAFFGLFAIFPFMIWFKLHNHCVWRKVLSFAAAWVLFEWLRSFILTGFPWNLLGTIWAFNPIFIQTASIWGTYGLSFWAIFAAGCIYVIICKRKYYAAVPLVALFLVMYVYGEFRMSRYSEEKSDTLIRLVQPSIPQKMKWNRQMLENNFYEYIELSRQPGWENVDFIIWGETAMPFNLNENYYRWQITEAIPPEGYLITGAVRYDFDNGRPYNSLYVLNSLAEVEGFYDKSHLVPFGEYIPFRRYLPRWVRPVANNIADFGTGEKYKNLRIGSFPAFGALICYEIIFPDQVINRKNKPDWLVVLTNDGWYGNSSGPYQHLVSAQMRAVEEGITIVRSANSGVSAVINPVGRIIERIPLHEKGFSDVYLPLNLKLSTAYNYYGNLPILISMILILLISSNAYVWLLKSFCVKK